MRNTFALLLLICLAALTACNQSSQRNINDADVIDEYEQASVDRSTLPAGDFTAESVLDAVSQAGGLTQLPKDIANRVIDNYLMRLGDVSTASMIVKDLKLVKGEINSGIIDRGEVGRALLRMGAQTRLIAADDSAYQALGTALKMSGEQLVGKNPDVDRDRG